MARLIAFSREVLVGARELSPQAKWLWTVITFILPLVGFTVAQFVEYLKDLQPWSIYLLFPPAIWLAARAGAAVERTTGPIIWMGHSLDPDEYALLFELRVENKGLGVVVAHAYAVELLDRYGRRIPRIDSEMEVHWRGQQRQMTLFGDKHGFAGFLYVDKQTDAQNPRLYVATIPLPTDPPGIWRVAPLFTAPIVEGRQDFRLRIRVDFRDEHGAFLKSRKKEVSIACDHSLPLCYRVQTLNWFTKAIWAIRYRIRRWRRPRPQNNATIQAPPAQTIPQPLEPSPLASAHLTIPQPLEPSPLASAHLDT